MRLHLDRRIPQYRPARGNIGQDLRCPAGDHVAAHGQVVGNAHLPAEHNPVAHDGRSRNAGLCGKQAIAPALNIVGHVNEIVELAPIPDLRVADGALVDTGIAADLDFGDYLDYLVSDPATKSILLYIEGISDNKLLLEL